MLSLSWHNRAKTSHLGTNQALALNVKCLICSTYFVESGDFNPRSREFATEEMQNPDGSRPRYFSFRLHPLMFGEGGGENTSDALVIHYCERLIVFGRQDAVRLCAKPPLEAASFHLRKHKKADVLPPF